MGVSEYPWMENRRWHRYYGGFSMAIGQHHMRTPEKEAIYDQPCTWNTYLLLSDKRRVSRTGDDGKLEFCDEYAEPNPLVDRFWPGDGELEGLPWNGGITLSERKIMHPSGIRMIKVGDDYCHIWDIERADLYDLKYMQRQCDTLAEALKALATPP
jgi:hypothetical protein